VTVSNETLLLSKPFYESITLVLKNLYPNVPFGFLNNFIPVGLFLGRRVALFSDNSKSLFRCNTSFPVIIFVLVTHVSFLMLLLFTNGVLVRVFSTFLHSLSH